MFRINELKLTGNITKPPKIVPVGAGNVTKATLAHNQLIYRKELEPLETVVFIDLEIWGPRGDAFGRNVTTKTPVFIEGELVLDAWEDQETRETKTRLKVKVKEWQFLLPKERAALES